MNPHPSDLALERLFAREPGTAEVQAHLDTCEACRLRWHALHSDEGRPLPQALTPRVVPAPAGRLPWMVAAATSFVALAASAALILGPSSDVRVTELRAEVAELEHKLQAAQAPEAEAPSADAQRTLPSPVVEEPLPELPPEAADIPPEVLEVAVEREIRRRSMVKLETARKRNEDEIFGRIGGVVDALVADAVLTDHEAVEVELLLQDELVATWAIKADVVSGELGETEAWAEWKDLRQDTEAGMLDYLEADEVKRLRETLDGGGKKTEDGDEG